MSEIVKLYNPANATALTPQELEGLQQLTNEDIKALAEAYPNAGAPGAYLLIIDSSKPIEKQLPSLSTFQNLYNLRVKNGLKNFVAYQFKGNYKPHVVTNTARSKEILDLTDTELLTLPGFKTGSLTTPAKEVQVKKVKKEKIK